MEIGLSLGSNLGDRLKNLEGARAAIARLPGAKLVASSRVYETEPVGVRPEFAGQRFLNAVIVIVTTTVSPQDLLAAIHSIEAGQGRVRTEDRNAPRPVDIDMIYAGDCTLGSPSLTLPHPRWAERRYVVQPLADVRPALRLPGRAETVAEVLLSLPESPKAVVYSPQWRPYE